MLSPYEVHEEESDNQGNEQNNEQEDERENSIEEDTFKNITNLNSYYRYVGSLTRPPCTEGLFWNVIKTTINISSNQV